MLKLHVTMFCDANFIYGLYHDCARTLRRSLAGKLAIVQLSSGFGFTHSSSRAPCALASFSRARMPRIVRTRDVTCELYCSYIAEAPKSEPTLPELLTSLKKVVNWDTFGAFLLPEECRSQISIIRQSKMGNVDDCKMALYEHYLRVGEKSWENLWKL